MSALTVYWTNNSDSLLTNAATMVANQTGAASTGVNGVTVSTAASGWGEFWFRGGQPASWPNLGAMGSPTGHGAIFDSTLLDGCTISAGTWTPTIRHSLTNGNGTLTADIWFNFYDFDGVSTYTLIGSSTTTSVAITSTTVTLALTAANLSAHTFAAGHKLYLDAWLHPTANANTATTAVWRLNVASSTTLGAATSQVVCPTYFLIAPTATVTSNSVLIESAQVVAATTSVISNEALATTSAQVVAAPTNALANGAMTENAQILASATAQANGAITESALLIATATAQANTVMSIVAQILASAVTQGNSALVITGAQILALVILAANSVLLGTGGSIAGSVIPPLPAPSGSGAVNAPPLASDAFVSVPSGVGVFASTPSAQAQATSNPSAGTATNAPMAGTVLS